MNAEPPDVPALVASHRGDSDVVMLEGFHALKHALRFGATIELVVVPEPDAIEGLAADLAPDVPDLLPVAPVVVPDQVWGQVAGRLRSPVLAVAKRPSVDVQQLLLSGDPAPVVLLEHPTHAGNVGAVVRVAAAAGCAGVLVLGELDPWGPTAIRGGAGLQFALPVGRLDRLEQIPTGRPLVALDPGGAPLRSGTLPSRAVVAFGTERHGLSPDLLQRANQRIGIPMRPGVSSLNLATAVAVTLYTGGAVTAVGGTS